MTDNENRPNDSHALIPEDGIGLRIKSAREARKYSQIDMHKLTGLSRTVLINYEAGRHKPSAREIKLICDALKISPNFLIYGTEKPHEIQQGIASKLMALDEGSTAMILTILVPLLAGILGRDEKRLILEFVETVIKAKSPELLSDIMSILNAVPYAKDIDIEKALEQHPNPELAKKFLSAMKSKVSEIPIK